uniref:Uncharacterized protein n=1 Tax=Meloidogyne incognita TaxID=6306 RepID=A0A914NBP6_MELIC
MEDSVDLEYRTLSVDLEGGLKSCRRICSDKEKAAEKSGDKGYFEWTKTYRKTTYRLNYYRYSPLARQSYINVIDGSYAPEYNPLCNLCELLHKQHRKHQKYIIRNIWNYWKSPDVCIDNWADLWLKGKHIKAYNKANWK